VTASTTHVPRLGRAEVRVLLPADLPAAAGLLARGFAEEPGNVALLPDPGARRVLVETSAASTLRTVLPYGSVHGALVGDELAAVAVWHPPGVATTSLAGAAQGLLGVLANVRTVAAALPHASSVVVANSPGALRLLRLRGRAVARASQGVCWHLAFLATSPDHRGHGLARSLLERQLARCDEDGAAAWLETTDPVNPPIYERFGFETVAHIDEAAWLPGLWVMRRDPAGGGPADRDTASDVKPRVR
jgi:GNAT superfamily N-acetyltransferase